MEVGVGGGIVAFDDTVATAGRLRIALTIDYCVLVGRVPKNGRVEDASEIVWQ